MRSVHRSRQIVLAVTLACLASGAQASTWAAASSRPTPSISTKVRGELLSIVRREAAYVGENGQPYDIQAVGTTLGQAASAEGQPFGPSTHEPVRARLYLVAARGQFACGLCGGAPGQSSTGTVLTLQLDLHTLRVDRRGIGLRYPQMKLAGKPVKLG